MFVHESCSTLTFFFFFNDTATTEIYTLSLHDALPISAARPRGRDDLHHGAQSTARADHDRRRQGRQARRVRETAVPDARGSRRDRKSTRLNSSHSQISYAVFCLKKKKKKDNKRTTANR